MVQFFWLPFVVVSNFLVPSVLLAFLWYCFEPLLVIAGYRPACDLWVFPFFGSIGQLLHRWFSGVQFSLFVFHIQFWTFFLTIFTCFLCFYWSISFIGVYIYCLNLVRRLHNYSGGKPNDRFSICKDEIHVACGFLGFPLLFFFSLLVVVGTLCRGKKKGS